MSEPKKKTPKKNKALDAIKQKAQLVYFDADKKEVKSLKEILEKTTKVQEVFIPILGCIVKVGHIKMVDFAVMMEIKDQNEMARELLYKLIHSADSTATRKQIEELPFQIAVAIINQVMGGGLGFLKDMT